MRKILFIFFLSIVGKTVFAQYFQYGITVGTEISSYDANNVQYNLGWSDYRYNVGYKVALNVEYAFIPDMLYLASEFAFTQRGSKQELPDSTLKHTTTTNYLQLPVNLLYKVEIGEDSQFLTFIGPYISYVLSGKTKWERRDNGRMGEDIHKYGRETGLKPIDLGFDIGIGFEFYSYFLKFQYSHSLINLFYGEGIYLKNKSFGISLGYIF
jgi:hypothetical protein